MAARNRRHGCASRALWNRKAAALSAPAMCFGITAIEHDERRWNARSRQWWLIARLTAIFVFFSFIIGMPLGNYFAHLNLNNGSAAGWSLLDVYSFDVLIFAFIVPALILLLGYAMSHLTTMLSAAESIAAAAQQMTTPDLTAARNADSVGVVVQGHMSALNEGLDGALTRLASVEAMIRQHVEAIELAGDAIEHKATGAVERVAGERSRLMDLTESLNAHADSFAAAIAERAKSGLQTLEQADQISIKAEKDFDNRLAQLEEAAARAFNGFEALRDALRDTDESMRASAASIGDAADQTMKATQKAKAASDAAAESAAYNAANVAASASRAADIAKKAADDAIKTAAEEAERVTQGALDFAAEETAKMQDAAAHAVDEMSKSTKAAIDAARADANKAVKAATDVSAAAAKTSDAAKKASSDVTKASEHARKTSEEALKFSEAAAGQIEQRNKALADARAALEKENQRLETLIDEQRNRADKLAGAIASQTERLSKLAEAQLREQEAAARLAEAQNEMQARAQREAEEKARAEKEAKEKAAKEEAARLEAEKKAAAEEERKRAKAEKEKARRQKEAEAIELTARNKSQKNQNGAARLEELARDIAERRPSGPAASKKKAADNNRSKGDVSWREILDAADDGEPLDLGAAAKKSPAEIRDDAVDAIRIISKLQEFTYALETRLYGDPPVALQERYDRGDRNVFANRLLRLNEVDVKRRIRSESARDRAFEREVHEFLQGFERLLEDATTSDTADEELEEYLSSPLGRVYLLIGATVGYFA